MSLAGQVLCQRMLIGPCALTIDGATAVAAAPAAATFRKRRRLDVPPLLALVIVVSLLDDDPPLGPAVLVEGRQGPARVFGKIVRNDATLGRGLQQVLTAFFRAAPLFTLRQVVRMSSGPIASMMWNDTFIQTFVRGTFQRVRIRTQDCRNNLDNNGASPCPLQLK